MWGTSLRKVADEAQFLALLRLVKMVAPHAGVTILARPHPDAIDISRDRAVSIIPTSDLATVAKTLARADLFIMVGGCFMESPRQAAVCSTLMVIATACRTPVIAIGVTAFPYRRPWARWIYRRVLNATQEITVREPAAQKALSDLSVRTRITRLDDPRYVLTPTPNDTSNGLLETLGLAQHRPLVCVTLRHLHDNMPEWVKVSHGYSQNAVDRANESLARALDTLATEAQLVVLPMHATRDEDMAAAAAIKARMRNPQALCCNLPPLRALQLLSFVKRCDLVLASRLAAGMFSVSTATPVIGIAYEKRLIDLMSSVGLGTYVVPWLGADSDHLEAIAKRAWAARRHIRTLLLSSSRSVVESARSNAGVIARHLV